MVKIPAQRHGGVKDPEKQKLKRLESISHKVNDPPKHNDDQPVPKSVSRLAQLMHSSQIIHKGKKKKRKANQTSAVFNSLGVKISQGKLESDKTFLSRVHKATKRVIDERKMEDRYNFKVERNFVTGEIKKIFVDTKTESQESKLGKKKDKQKQLKMQPSELTRVKRSKKKIKKTESFKDFEERDNIQFGEIVHEPPSLSIPKKISDVKKPSKPGKRNLLLKNLGDTSETPEKKHKKKAEKKESEKIDKTVKRKKLPIEIRKQLELRQKEVMDVYKALKGTRAGTVT